MQAEELCHRLALSATDPLQAKEALAALWQAVSRTTSREQRRDMQELLVTVGERGEELRVRAFALPPSGGLPAARALLLDRRTVTASRLPQILAIPAPLSAGFQLLLEALQADVGALAATGRRLDVEAHADLTERIRRELLALGEGWGALNALAAVQAGARSLTHAPLDLGDLLMALMPHWKPRAPQHAFELALPGEVPRVNADEACTTDVLDLLLEAAVRWTPAGGDIRVSVRPSSAGVEVSVHPQHGVSAFVPDELDYIFVPFYRATEAPQSLVRGGVGLPLARALLEAHGGKLWAEAPAGRHDLLLRAWWPERPQAPARATSSAVSDQPSRAASEAGEAGAARGEPTAGTSPSALRHGHRTALLFDLDPRMVRYLRANLEERGFRPVIATSTAETLRLCELEEPELVLLDVAGAGKALHDLIGRMAELTGAPILLLTQRYDADECARLLELGATDYIGKPLHINELFARIRAALRPRAAAAVSLQAEPVFHTGDLAVDFGRRLVSLAGKEVALSKTEFKLLRVLAQHAGAVLSHDLLLERVWGASYQEETGFVWVYVRRLRRKIEPDPSKPRYLLTVPGIGYRLVKC
jgi:DNA-binding response OmpR family regulator/signal transduction histidine kinase